MYCRGNSQPKRKFMLTRLNTEYLNQYKNYNLLNIPLHTSYTTCLDLSTFARVRQHCSGFSHASHHGMGC